ncbi:calcium/manganese antiporter SLC30A10 [Aedes albopictus]|uniref:Zn2+ transporter znt1 n=1 Tax=Aedes albopictus TaxID=7160 RepID=A0ABM1Y153_AEDAL
MAMKEWIYRMQPVQLYIVLVLSILYFLVQLFLSHISHALVLLVDSYHMLCNIIALTGCILTIKHSKKQSEAEPCNRKLLSASRNSIDASASEDRFIEVPVSPTGDNSSSTSGSEVQKVKPTAPEDEATSVKQKVKAKSRQQRENSLKNTFGWTRIDVLTMLVVCIFLASFCFSAVVEALQTLSHIHHQDAMHYPLPVLTLGAMGIILNGFCYLLIGGYTYHQGSFLYITSSGTVILDRVVTGDGIRKGERRLSGSRRHVASAAAGNSPKRQSVRELMRDICSTIFVIVCSTIVHYTNEDEDTSKFVDPLCSIMSCVVLMVLSYPYMKESGMILLQTIPNTIDIEIFEQSLLKTFPHVVSVHDLHIWQLSGEKYVATAHIIFEDHKVYPEINDMVINFFHDQGISKVTIQPEFKTKLPELPLLTSPTTTSSTPANTSTSSCLMQCRQEACLQKHCCERIIKDDGKKSSATKSNSASKEKIEQIAMEVHPHLEAGTSGAKDIIPTITQTISSPTLAIENEAQVPANNSTSAAMSSKGDETREDTDKQRY